MSQRSDLTKKWKAATPSSTTDQDFYRAKASASCFVPRSDTAAEVGIRAVEEGHFQNGTWKPGRHLNCDEADLGGYWRFNPQRNPYERAALYEFK